ncbi:protein FAM151A isoform X2 [Orussus abietinus]|uniref:protein FAM151A isoform X2 n=1 Tax=Orussus abietinus TaxID=222816 RepID=UPI000625E129|nr:protein FAM151A isoform X2 [Orussus abietinus]
MCTRQILLIATIIQVAMCNASDIRDLFPEVKDNLTKVTWAHAVNSQKKLDDALQSDIMMLEADVIVGTLNTSGVNATDIPIMGHPPANESDLSLEDFLRQVLKNGKKGVKLDFKSYSAFSQSQPVIQDLFENATLPLWINADILAGPVNASKPDELFESFVKDTVQHFPTSTLSPGWTTRYGEAYNITDGQYTEEHVKEMLKSLSEANVTQSITYPVRAGLAANNVTAMESLLKGSPLESNATLTIWSSAGDHVDKQKLSSLIKTIGVDKVYLDVPKEVLDGLDVSNSTASAAGSLALGLTLVNLMAIRLL